MTVLEPTASAYVRYRNNQTVENLKAAIASDIKWSLTNPADSITSLLDTVRDINPKFFDDYMRNCSEQMEDGHG